MENVGVVTRGLERARKIRLTPAQSQGTIKIPPNELKVNHDAVLLFY